MLTISKLPESGVLCDNITEFEVAEHQQSMLNIYQKLNSAKLQEPDMALTRWFSCLLRFTKTDQNFVNTRG